MRQHKPDHQVALFIRFADSRAECGRPEGVGQHLDRPGTQRESRLPDSEASQVEGNVRTYRGQELLITDRGNPLEVRKHANSRPP